MMYKDKSSTRPWVPSYDRRKKRYNFDDASNVEDTIIGGLYYLYFSTFALASLLLLVEYIV